MILDWHPEAKFELLEAANYYDQQDEGLADQFRIMIRKKIEKVLINPLMPYCFYHECRRIKTDKFPYFLIYRVNDDLLQIIAVMHTSRRPGYWKDRLSN
jgi:toxin ParE1/3/4